MNRDEITAKIAELEKKIQMDSCKKMVHTAQEVLWDLQSME